MRHYRKALWQRLMLSRFVGALAISGARTIQAQGSAAEQALWKLEQDYWRYVQENNLAAYSTLWHERFLFFATGAKRQTPIANERVHRWPQLLGAHALRCPRKTILKRVQKIHYLGFLKVTQRVERVPHSRGLPSMPLNAVIEGK